MAAWIKITNVGGPDYINLDQLYKIVADPATFELTFYDSNSILPTTYTFASFQEYAVFLKKIEVATSVVDIDALAPQG